MKPSADATLLLSNGLSTGIVGCWPLLEGTGSTTADKSGGGRTATINNPTWQTVSGDAVLRGASNSLASPVTLSSALTLSSATDWTVAWRAVTTTDANAIVAGLSTSNPIASAFGMLGASNLFRYYNSAGVTRGVSRTLFTTLSDYAIVVDNLSGTKTAKFFVDGVQIGSTITLGGADEVTFDSLLGGENIASNWSMIGDLHYFYAWNRALSDAEVASLDSDPYQFLVVQVDSFTLDTPSRIWQRATSNAAVTLSGTFFHASADHVQARILLASNSSVVVDWTTIDPALSGTTWSGSITVPTGGPYLIETRLRSSGGSTLLTANGPASVIVGDVFISIGQSNADGFYDNYQTYSGTAPAWNVKFDGTIDETMSDPTGRGTSYGSWIPVLSTLLDSYLGGSVPLVFISIAQTTTSLSSRWLPPSGLNWIEANATITTLNLNTCRGVLWYQGESDALAGSTTYEANEKTLASYVDDWPGNKKMITTIIGNFPGDTTDANLDAVRSAKIANWTDSTTLAGPMTYDMDFVGPHIVTNAQAVQYAGRLFQTVKSHCYAESLAFRGPRIVSATYTGAVITITFDSDLLASDSTYTSAAWSVNNVGGTARTVSSVARSGTRTVAVTCSGDIDGTAPTITFGSGNTADGATVPRSTSISLPVTIHSVSAINLPAEPFLAYAVTEDTGGPGGNTVEWSQVRELLVSNGIGTVLIDTNNSSTSNTQEWSAVRGMLSAAGIDVVRVQ